MGFVGAEKSLEFSELDREKTGGWKLEELWPLSSAIYNYWEEN